MKAIIRCCCPCCLCGEQDEKRVKVTYEKANSPPQAEEKVSLLKPEEQPEDTVKENGDTEKEDAQDTPEPDHNDNEEDKDETMNGEVTEDIDENNRREIVTVTTTTTRTTSGGDESPKNLTREVLQKMHDKQESGKDEDTEVIEYVDKHGRRIRRILKKTVTTTVVKSRGSKGDNSNTVTTESGEHGSEKFLINFGGAGLQRSSEQQTTIQSESKPSDTYNLQYKRTSISRLIGGDDDQGVDERSTTSSGRDGEHPIVIVKKGRPQIDVPEWMEERKSPGTQRRILENSDISVHLKYPSDKNPEKNEPEEKANESTIQPEVAKRDMPDISILNLEEAVKEKEKDQQPASTVDDEVEEEDDDDDDDEEEEEGEYDEFEEEFVVMEVSRNPRFPKALEIPEPEPEKVGIPIEDLLEIPTLQVEQNSAPDDGVSVEEKIESEERNRVVFTELPIDFGMLE